MWMKTGHSAGVPSKDGRGPAPCQAIKVSKLGAAGRVIVAASVSASCCIAWLMVGLREWVCCACCSWAIWISAISASSRRDGWCWVFGGATPMSGHDFTVGWMLSAAVGAPNGLCWGVAGHCCGAPRTMRCALPWLPAGLHAQYWLWLGDELVRSGEYSVWHETVDCTLPLDLSERMHSWLRLDRSLSWSLRSERLMCDRALAMKAK